MSNVKTSHGELGIATEESGSQGSSKYCYLFDDLVKAESKRSADESENYFKQLEIMAKAMDSLAESRHRPSTLPAIYTYFGQFINHDLSAPTGTPEYSHSIKKSGAGTGVDQEIVKANPDAAALLAHERPESPDWLVLNIRNQHPKPLHLYSLYSTGPFEGNDEVQDLFDLDTMKFRLSATFDDPSFSKAELDRMLKLDIVRDKSKGLPKIADHRNDENVILSQLHLAFMLFHNKAIDTLKSEASSLKHLFELARAETTRLYQYCIVHDYLAKLVPSEGKSKQVQSKIDSAVPFEFTTAAFRFGHSMISQTYDYNRFFPVGDSEKRPASLVDLFNFTSRGKMKGSPTSTGQLPTHWVIEWERLLRVTEKKESNAEIIDLSVPRSMVDIPDITNKLMKDHGLTSICHRNLKRGYQRFMPSGQKLAKELNLKSLSAKQIANCIALESVREELIEAGFDKETPAWAYFLCEAQISGEGSALGPTAGAIVRGTIVGLIQNSPESALAFKDGKWKPETSPLKLQNGKPIKDIRDFLAFAGVLNSVLLET
jgi:hypothetical protein